MVILVAIMTNLPPETSKVLCFGSRQGKELYLLSVPALEHTHPRINLLKPTDYVMHQQFNIQQLYALPTLYLCVLYLSQNKQRLVPLTAQTDWFL